MDLFTYAFPVTAIGALLLTLAAYFEDVPPSLVFCGWIIDSEWLLWNSFLAFFPGTIYVSLNYVDVHT
jgi:hypothetical protein